MVIEGAPGQKPAEFMEALQQRQRLDPERSIRFAQREPSLGVRRKTA